MRLALSVIVLASCDAVESPPSVCETARHAPVLTTDPAPVIIHLRRDRHLAALTIEELRRDSARAQSRVQALLDARGIGPRATLWMIDAIAVTIPVSVVDEIARLPEVERIVPDIPMHIPREARGGSAIGWNLAAIKAPALWSAGTRGAGVVVAVLDSGVDAAHPALASSWRSAAGWFDPYGQHEAPFDSDGHGTQVAGIAVGDIGVAPEAQWIAAKIYDDAGVASLSGIHLALQWVLDPDGNPATDDAADVITGSWGFSEMVDECFLELEPDLAVLRAAQIAPVFAAGNMGPYPASSISPANNPSAFAVGAIDDQRAVIDASGRGPGACSHAVFPALVAPGASVLTTDRTFGGQFPDAYVTVSGTSFAAPHVAGAIALLRSAHPAATVSQLENALTGGAADLAPTGADNASGLGLLDVEAADARLASHTSTCTDDDGDGYFEEPGCGTPVDCDDDNAIPCEPASCH